VSGATQSGKTTMLGALLGSAPATERVVTVEETFELALDAPDWVGLQCSALLFPGRLLLQGAQNMVKPKVQTAQAPPQTTAVKNSPRAIRSRKAVPHGILKNARQAAKLHVTGSMADRA